MRRSDSDLHVCIKVLVLAVPEGPEGQHPARTQPDRLSKHGRRAEGDESAATSPAGPRRIASNQTSEVNTLLCVGWRITSIIATIPLYYGRPFFGRSYKLFMHCGDGLGDSKDT